MAELKQAADLVAMSLEALERCEEKQAALKDGANRSPMRGDVYALRETADDDVDWVLVAHDPADARCFLAVPADDHFLAGSADVEFADGSLWLRCRFATWIDAELLAADLRVGMVPSTDVERARQRWLDLGDGKVTGSVLAREVDDDPEYKDWCGDVLEPARRRVAGMSETKEDDAPDKSEGVVVPFRRSVRFTMMRVAASVALTMAGLAFWRSYERIQSLEMANRIVEERYREVEEKRDRSEAERIREADAHRLELERAGKENEQAAQQYRDQIATLDERLEEARKARKPSDVVNPAVIVFDEPQLTTRGRRKVTLSSGASHIVLFFALRERSPASRYRLVLREQGKNEVIWANDRLTLEEPEIRVGLPASILTPGGYDLELLRVEGGAFSKVGDYELEVLASSDNRGDPRNKR